MRRVAMAEAGLVSTVTARISRRAMVFTGSPPTKVRRRYEEEPIPIFRCRSEPSFRTIPLFDLLLYDRRVRLAVRVDKAGAREQVPARQVFQMYSDR